MKPLSSILLAGSMLQPLGPAAAAGGVASPAALVVAQADQPSPGERPRPHRERGGAAAGDQGAPGADAPGRKRSHEGGPAAGEAPGRRPPPHREGVAPGNGEAPVRRPAQRDAAPGAGEAPARRPAQREAAPSSEAPAHRGERREGQGYDDRRVPEDRRARGNRREDSGQDDRLPDDRRGRGDRRDGRGPDDRRPPEDRREGRGSGDGKRPDERREGRGPQERRLPDERRGQGDGEDRRGRRGAAVGAAAAGVAVGVFLAATGARRIDEIRRDRQEREEGGYRVIREPGRTIVRDRDRVFIVHDETERFRTLDPDARVERRGDEIITVTGRRGGPQIVTVTDRNGRLLRRVRRFPDGREVVIIDNGPPVAFADEIVELPPPPLRIPRDRYVVTTERADERMLYETLSAPPVAPVERRYTLDQVRASRDLRARMRSVDIDTLNFETGSWDIGQDQADRLALIARALKQTIQRNPNEVFLVEGYTDAVGNDVDNLSLSDRRAQSVATALTQDLQVPPENLTTQGYGAKYLKIDTQEASRENRRVTIRRVTPLLAAQANR